VNRRFVFVLATGLSSFGVMQAIAFLSGVVKYSAVDRTTWLYQLGFFLPMAVAMMISAGRFVYGPASVRLGSGALAIRIVLYAYALLVVWLALVLPLNVLTDGSAHYGDAFQQILMLLLLASFGAAFVGFVAMSITIVPMLLMEYLIVLAFQSHMPDEISGGASS
jgi:hypothetical protein